jgi:hypothetical protein
VEFGTLPPYLYAMYSIKPEMNPEAYRLFKSVALQEMIHMCLASNILNALGGNPALNPPKYPGTLPGDIGPEGGQPLTIHIYAFSQAAADQGMKIEEPVAPPNFPVKTTLALAEPPKAVTIGEFYTELDEFLSTLPPSAWQAGRNQIVDDQFFPGQLFAVNDYPTASKAISEIVSEGEGSSDGTTYNPLDFQHQIAHYFRFGEIYHDRVLTKADTPEGYQWGPQKLGVNWAGKYPAIDDPALHDFSKEPPEAQAAQKRCNAAYKSLVDLLQQALTGADGAMGQAVRAMFDLRLAALSALTVPLNDGRVAGPAFVYHV